MSDQPESPEVEPVPAGEPVVVEPVEDHEPESAPEPGPSEGEVGRPNPDPVDEEPLDYQAERYARACVDPDYAAVQAIEVADEDKGEAWASPPGEPVQYDGLLRDEDGEPVDPDTTVDHADDGEEV